MSWDPHLLTRPRKPCPQYLRGDQAYLGKRPVLMTCRTVKWKDGRWVYTWAKALTAPISEAAE